MRVCLTLPLILGAALAGCGGGNAGLLDRERPDEFAVQRQAPLIVPPDFQLVPPGPGAPRPGEGATEQAMAALFGGPAQRSGVEYRAVQAAGEADPGIRSSVGDTATNTVNKGAATQSILAAPEGDGQDASAAIPAAPTAAPVEPDED
ncbi:DUF3035 domain-containing protein [Croceibacterium ferulae]|uniref:DUF3035 domain-containing protein n=1 Tax=Croceibacterium ferulae TaxID=1854641 RepID=UPI000EABE677|nr:DUF3035 domain-containing protein [Croceibacterium ferulae]